MEAYLYDEHPRPNTDSAPLFHKSAGWSKGDDDDGSMTPALVRQRLERLVEAGDTELKPEDVHPHVFRHTAVTIWARQGFTDREIKHRAGWSRDSDMLDRYEHITEDEINKQVLKKYGFDVSDDNVGEPELDRCPRCSAPLHGAANYCPRCSAQLNSPDETVEDVLIDKIIDNRNMPVADWVSEQGWQTAMERMGSREVTNEEVQALVDAVPESLLDDVLTKWHRQRLRERYGVSV